MSRLFIDMTPGQHQKIKAIAAYARQINKGICTELNSAHVIR